MLLRLLEERAGYLGLLQIQGRILGQGTPQDCQFSCTLVFQELGQGFHPQKSKHSIFAPPQLTGAGVQEAATIAEGKMCLNSDFPP